MANLMLSVMGAFAEFDAPSLKYAKGKASAWPSNAVPTKDGKRPSLRNGPPSSFSAPEPVFQKRFLPATKGSAEKPRHRCRLFMPPMRRVRREQDTPSCAPGRENKWTHLPL